MKQSELALCEELAQGGIIQFAEQMQRIRDERLYPNAGEHGDDPWATYCRERWSLSKSQVDGTIRALPVLRRISVDDVHRIPVSAAASVATLPESVQDAILAETTNRDEVKQKAKAARREGDRIRVQEGREPEPEELTRRTRR